MSTTDGSGRKPGEMRVVNTGREQQPGGACGASGFGHNGRPGRVAGLLGAMVLVLGLLCGTSMAQEEEEEQPFMVASGTAVRNASGGTSAYLFWQSTRVEELAGRVVAIYRKAGSAGSGAPYERRSVTGPQNDPRVVASLRARVQIDLGLRTEGLEASLDALFQNVVPTSLALDEKLCAVIEGSLGDPRRMRSLALLARSQPLVALSLGHAFAEPLPAGGGAFTYELREIEAATGRTVRVLGRVTVDPAVPSALPAPGTVVIVDPPANRVAEGHLNVRLRWSVPEALSVVSPRQSGYNVYRVHRGFAESRGFGVTPPPASELQEYLIGAAKFVSRVNRFPVLTDRDLSVHEAADPEDDETFFLADDNHRFDDGGVALRDGEEYYYYVTATDVLGMDGQLSAGALATVCDRLAPPPPRGVRVEPEYRFDGGGEQRLSVFWDAVEDPESGVAAYHVYRYSSIEEMQEGESVFDAEGVPTRNRIAVVPHVGGTEAYQFTDETPGAPVDPAPPGQAEVTGRTYVYAVRAIDHGSCGGNVSAPSGPGLGALQDREGPAAPGGRVEIACLLPEVQFLKMAAVGKEEKPSGEAYHFWLECLAVPGTLDWVEFYADTVFLGRVRFTGEERGEVSVASLRTDIPVPFPGTYAEIRCRVGARDGRVSDTAVADIPHPSNVSLAQRFRITFVAGGVAHRSVVGGVCGTTHFGERAVDGARNPATVVVEPGEDSADVRIFRQVDGGDLELVHVEGAADDGAPVTWSDAGLPLNAGEVCYYAQTFDDAGNPSPMRQVGECFQVVVPSELPVPLLSVPEGSGDVAGPRMRLRFFCPPYEVERFEVWIGGRRIAPIPVLGGGLSGQLSAVRPNYLPGTEDVDFGVYETAVVRSGNVGQGPMFIYEVPVTPGIRYEVVVRAVGGGAYGDRVVGGFSNHVSFTWTEAEAEVGEDVPWPARPLPSQGVATGFHSAIEAVVLPKISTLTSRGLGILIGDYQYEGSNASLQKGADVSPTSSTGDLISWVPGTGDPLDLVYRDQRAVAGDAEVEARLIDTPPPSLLPALLYRVEVPTPSRPVVSGDVVQVSPLIEAIAFGPATLEGDAVGVIYDPFFIAVGKARVPGISPTLNNYGLFLRDRHPVIMGATYAYLIVRFGPDREILEVLSTNVVTVPEP